MEYFCELCYKYINRKSKHKHFKSKAHKEFDKCNYISLTFENPNINYIDELFYA